MKDVLRFCLRMLTAHTVSVAAPITIKSPSTALDKQKVDAFFGARNATKSSARCPAGRGAIAGRRRSAQNKRRA